MNQDEGEARIVSSSDILLGKPVVRGTRIPVYPIVDLVAAGMSAEEIVDDYPDLSVPDVEAALAFSTLHHVPASTIAQSV